MNIEFENLKEVCHNHPINEYRCYALSYDEDNKSFQSCTEANCPLKSEYVAVRMSECETTVTTSPASTLKKKAKKK